MILKSKADLHFASMEQIFYLFIYFLTATAEILIIFIKQLEGLKSKQIICAIGK